MPKAELQYIITGLEFRIASPRQAWGAGSAVSALDCWRPYNVCGIAKRVFRVRAARRRGKAEAKSLPQPRTSLERTYENFGHPSRSKEASRRAPRTV